MKMIHSIRVAISLCVLLAGTQLVRAEKWELLNGEIEGKLTGVYGTKALIVGKNTVYLQALETFNDAGLDRIARFLAAQPTEKIWAESTSVVARDMENKLQVLKDDALIAFKPGTRPEPELYIFYFSSRGSPPSCEFTPRLIEVYRRFAKRALAEKMEILFYSYDRKHRDYLAYVKENKMPWLILKHCTDSFAIGSWTPKRIPGLVVVHRDGDIIFHSEEAGGAGKVIDDLFALLREMDPSKPMYRKGTHRLAIRQQLLLGTNQSLPAKVHYINTNHKQYKGLEGNTIQVHCLVNGKGFAENFTTEPSLPAANLAQLREDIGKWLFIPAIENGIARSQEIVVPVNF